MKLNNDPYGLGWNCSHVFMANGDTPSQTLSNLITNMEKFLSTAKQELEIVLRTANSSTCHPCDGSHICLVTKTHVNPKSIPDNDFFRLLLEKNLQNTGKCNIIKKQLVN